MKQGKIRGKVEIQQIESKQAEEKSAKREKKSKKLNSPGASKY